MSATQGRVLLAVSAQTRRRVLSAFAGYEVAWAQTEAEVRAALCTSHFDLAVVGSHFDESHTFDIVRGLRRADPALRIVCVRGRPFPGALGRSTMKAFRARLRGGGGLRGDRPPRLPGRRRGRARYLRPFRAAALRGFSAGSLSFSMPIALPK
jgi:hypothetical protein